jgi:hypothetical protein
LWYNVEENKQNDAQIIDPFYFGLSFFLPVLVPPFFSSEGCVVAVRQMSLSSVLCSQCLWNVYPDAMDPDLGRFPHPLLHFLVY